MNFRHSGGRERELDHGDVRVSLECRGVGCVRFIGIGWGS